MKFLKPLSLFIILLSCFLPDNGQEKPFPILIQKDQVECGPTCLQMVCKYYGVSYERETLNKLCNLRSEGTSMGDISEAATTVGLYNLGVKIDYETLLNDAPLPAMLHWKNNHFVLAYKITKDSVWIADPAVGLVTYQKELFLPYWVASNPDKVKKAEGYALLFETTESFYNEKNKQAVIKLANRKKSDN